MVRRVLGRRAVVVVDVAESAAAVSTGRPRRCSVPRTYRVATFSSPGFDAMVDKRVARARRLDTGRGRRDDGEEEEEEGLLRKTSRQPRQLIKQQRMQSAQLGRKAGASCARLGPPWSQTMPPSLWPLRERPPPATDESKTRPTTGQPACSSSGASRGVGAYSCGAASRLANEHAEPAGAGDVLLERVPGSIRVAGPMRWAHSSLRAAKYHSLAVSLSRDEALVIVRRNFGLPKFWETRSHVQKPPSGTTTISRDGHTWRRDGRPLTPPIPEPRPARETTRAGVEGKPPPCTET